MAFVDLDSVRHFQPPRSTDRPLKGRSESRSTMWKRGASTVSSEHCSSMVSVPKTKTSADLENREPAGCIDLTIPPPMETGGDSFGDSFGEPALSSRGTETVQDPLSVGAHLTAGQKENDEPLLSVEELLRDAGETQERQCEVTSVNSGSERADGAVERINPNDRDGSSPSQPKSDGDEYQETTDPGSVHPRGDGLVSDGRGEQHGALGPPSIAASGSDARTVNLREKTDHPTSGPTSRSSPVSLPPPPPSSPPLSPPPPHPLEARPTDTDLSSIFEKQAEPNGGAFEEIGSGPSSNRKEKADVDDGHDSDVPYRSRTARGAGGVRASFKRPADIADVNEGREGVPRSEKARRLGPIDAIDNTDQEMSDLEFARLRALPEPVFRIPPSWQNSQQRENTAASPSGSSKTGGSQENPLVVGDDDDDDEKPGENGGSTRATSVELKLGPANPQDSSSPGKAETHARLSTCTPQPPTEPADRPISPSAALPQQTDIGVVDIDDRGAVAVATPPNASPPPPAQPSPAPAPVLEAEEEEWEIRKIVGKRRAGKGYKYRVRWKDTWLSKSELGNARRLLREFEAQRRTQREG